MQTITNEIKAKYYNQYQFSHVCFEGISNSIWTVGVCVAFGYYIINGDYGKIYMENTSPLLLTSLEDISNEHAAKIPKLDFHNRIRGTYTKEDLLNEIKIIGFLTSLEADLLRQLGYAIDFTTIVDGKVVTYSVNDLVELNVIKLKK
jgi:hypothetical protein